MCIQSGSHAFLFCIATEKYINSTADWTAAEESSPLLEVLFVLNAGDTDRDGSINERAGPRRKAWRRAIEWAHEALKIQLE
jgi:hypothetical protein